MINLMDIVIKKFNIFKKGLLHFTNNNSKCSFSYIKLQTGFPFS